MLVSAPPTVRDVLRNETSGAEFAVELPGVRYDELAAAAQELYGLSTAPLDDPIAPPTAFVDEGELLPHRANASRYELSEDDAAWLAAASIVEGDMAGDAELGEAVLVVGAGISFGSTAYFPSRRALGAVSLAGNVTVYRELIQADTCPNTCLSTCLNTCLTTCPNTCLHTHLTTCLNP